MRKAWFLPLARAYCRRRFRRTFENVRIAGETAFLDVLGREPLVLAFNHVSYWDALLLVLLDERWGGGGVALMDTENLRKLPFFSWVGAIGLDRSSPKRALADLRAAAGLLGAQARYVVLFPQGTEVPAHLPLRYHSGIERLAKTSGRRVVPVAVRYDFGRPERPFVHVVVGEPLDGGANLPDRLARRTEELLRTVDTEMLAINAGTGGLGPTGFVEVFERRAPDVTGGFGARALSMFAAREEPK